MLVAVGKIFILIVNISPIDILIAHICGNSGGGVFSFIVLRGGGWNKEIDVK